MVGTGERRRFERLPVEVPLSVSTELRRDRVGMIRDLSASGVLFHSLSRYALGERVTVMFVLGDHRSYASGSVVRAAIDPNLDNMFKHLTAVRFDAPLDLDARSEVQLAHV